MRNGVRPKEKGPHSSNIKVKQTLKSQAVVS